jgi:hypothetical protein
LRRKDELVILNAKLFGHLSEVVDDMSHHHSDKVLAYKLVIDSDLMPHYIRSCATRNVLSICAPEQSLHQSSEYLLRGKLINEADQAWFLCI